MRTELSVPIPEMVIESAPPPPKIVAELKSLTSSVRVSAPAPRPSFASLPLTVSVLLPMTMLSAPSPRRICEDW